MAPGQGSQVSDIPLSDQEAQRLKFQWEWAKLGREWYRLMELSPSLADHIRVELAKQRKELEWARSQLEQLGMLPPKGTS